MTESIQLQTGPSLEIAMCVNVRTKLNKRAVTGGNGKTKVSLGESQYVLIEEYLSSFRLIDIPDYRVLWGDIGSKKIISHAWTGLKIDDCFGEVVLFSIPKYVLDLFDIDSLQSWEEQDRSSCQNMFGVVLRVCLNLARRGIVESVSIENEAGVRVLDMSEPGVWLPSVIVPRGHAVEERYCYSRVTWDSVEDMLAEWAGTNLREQ